VTITYSPTAQEPSDQMLTVSGNDPKNPSDTVEVKGRSDVGPTATPTQTPLGVPAPTSAKQQSAKQPKAQPSPVAIFAADSLAYALLGNPSAGPSRIREYLPASDSIAVVGTLDGQRVGSTATLLPNGQILIAGGGNCAQAKNGRTCTATDTAQLFNPLTKAISAAGQGSGGIMSTARMGHSATLISGCGCALDGDVLIAGGNSGSETLGPKSASASQSASQSAELYDYRTDSFVPVPNSMITAREEAVALAIPNGLGKILLAGGDSTGIFQNSIAAAEIFDPVLQTFTATGPMNTPRELASAAALDPNVVSGSLAGQILVSGGLDATGNLAGDSLASAELYNPGTGTWTNVSSTMAAARATHTMTLLTNGSAAGEILIAGGHVLHAANGALQHSSTANAELFDTITSMFVSAAPMQHARGGHNANLLPGGSPSGRVFVSGGQDCSAGSACAAVTKPLAEFFDPATSTWSASKAKPSGAGGLGQSAPLQ
jgi:Galactose oxidase, central domain